MSYVPVQVRGHASGLLLLLLVSTASLAAPGWDVSNTGQPANDVEFTLTEGTWMNLDVTPDGQAIYFDLLGDIYRVPATGGDATRVLGGPAIQRSPNVSPDGRQLLYLSDADGTDNLWIANLDGTGARQVTHETVDMLMGPTWGPAGTVAASKMVATFARMRATEILWYDLAGGGGRVLVEAPKNGRDVQETQFSPDGRYVYYTQRLNDPEIYVDGNHINYAIQRRELATGVTEQLLAGFGSATTPQLSRDGRQLAFIRRVMAKTVLFVYDTESRVQRPVYEGLDRDDHTDFVPQGSYYPHFAWFPDHRHVAIWAKGRLVKVDTTTGEAAAIPFRARAKHRIVVPLRVAHDLAPETLEVRAIRPGSLAPDGQSLVFSALAHLWRKTLPEGRPARLTDGVPFEFEPAHSPDGRQLAYVEWDDERGSALKVMPADGGEAVVVATSLGVIRQPRFSPDGEQLVYRIQDNDKSMSGYRARAGIYLVSARGGESRYVTSGDDWPMFSPDGTRIYVVVVDWSGDSAVHRLESVTLDGHDRRVHVQTPDADTRELRPSPDLRWVGFKDHQQYYVAAYRETGAPLTLSASSDAVPVARLTDVGGYNLAWSADSTTLHWTLGPSLYRARAAERISADPAAPLPKAYTSAGLQVPTDRPQGRTAFTNGRVITMRGEEVLERGTVVVDGNRIVAVGPAEQVAVPADAKVIDVAGKTVLPGFIDMHGHIDCCYETGVTPIKQPTRYAALAFGITSNLDPYSTEVQQYESNETNLAGITVGPRWFGSGHVVYGRAAKSDFTYVPIETIEDARRVMQRKRALGGLYVKSYKQPARFQRQMLAKAGREAGVMVDGEGESHFYNGLGMILDGYTNLEHNMPVATYYDDVVQLFSRAQASNTPTLIVNFGELMGENYMYQTTRAWEDPKLRTYVQETISYYSPLAPLSGAPPYVRGMTSIHAADEIYDIGFRSMARSVKKLDDAGVIINAGSHGQVPGLALHWEMALMAEGGMSNARILRTATLNGARTLGLDKQLGSLEPGKLADLIVLDRNPLEDIHNTNSVRYTMLNGRLYEAATMNEIGRYDRPRSKFYWELNDYRGIDWNEAWSGP